MGVAGYQEAEFALQRGLCWVAGSLTRTLVIQKSVMRNDLSGPVTTSIPYRIVEYILLAYR